MPYLETLVGPRVLQDGASPPARSTREAALVVQQARGRYHEAVSRGRCYAAHTAATGVAPGTSIGTTAAFALYNPKNSGVNLSVLWAGLGYVSGTLGAGFISWVVNTNPAAAATTGTDIVPVNLLVGGPKGVANPFTTATLPAAPTLLLPFCNLGASLATTAVQPWVIEQTLDGAILVAPGCTLSLEGTTAAGSSPLVVYGVCWEEVPA